MRWLSYCLLTLLLGASIFPNGGTSPRQWEWIALGFGIASTLCVFIRPRAPGGTWGLTILALLLGWMILPLVPLPPGLIGRFSPQHSSAISAARLATGQETAQWAAWSLAPAVTMERLLDVLPAMAVFVAARQMGWGWAGRAWIVVAPVIAVAWLESALGLVQFYLMRLAGGAAGSVSGTYMNRDHYAGLLEMAFPLALLGAIAIWRGNRNLRAGPALGAALLLAAAACLLMAIVVSLSRMGFLSTLIAAGLTMLVLAGSLGGRPAWRWSIPVAILLAAAFFLPTRELAGRFAELAATDDISKDTRKQIWQDTAHLIADSRWTGAGLGAYERGLYRVKTAAPVNTVDFAHNDYLQILAELGVVGALLAAAFAIWILRRLLHVVLFRRESANWELAVGLLGGLLTIGVHSLADFNLYIPGNALAFAWLCGVAAGPGLKKG